MHPDHLGSTALLTCYLRPTGESCPDGTPVRYMRYDAFGTTKVFGLSNFPITNGDWRTDRLYTGQRLDQTTGLYDYRARTYDPASPASPPRTPPAST